MPGTISPSQMYEHELNPVKGWPSPYAVDFSAPLDSEAETINNGSVCVLTNSVTLLGGGGPANEVPLFLLEQLAADTGNIVGGECLVLPSLASYEVQTTEYDTTQDYAPNTYLTPATGDDAGKVTVGTPYTNKICGIVSKGVVTNEYRVNVLQFWTYFLPAMTASPSPTPSPTPTPTA